KVIFAASERGSDDNVDILIVRKLLRCLYHKTIACLPVLSVGPRRIWVSFAQRYWRAATFCITLYIPILGFAHFVKHREPQSGVGTSENCNGQVSFFGVCAKATVCTVKVSLTKRYEAFWVRAF